MPRWEIHFKFAMLRMISFNMDYYWACRHDYQPLNVSKHIHDFNGVCTYEIRSK
jgi:hypothetical protein